MRCALSIALLLSGMSAFTQRTITYQVILRSDFGVVPMWDGTLVPIYSLNPSLGSQPKLPARTLYANEGDTVVLHATSVAQGHHHTIHLHGLDVDTRNDGDPATSFALSHMQDTTYTFVARNAGTYLYHCHVGDVVHVQMGMYGLIVVKAAGGVNTAWTGGPAFHSSRNWLMSEIDKSWHDTVPAHDTTTGYITLPEYAPDYFLINGKSEYELDDDDSTRISGAQNEVIYLRLGNIGFLDNMIVFPPALNATIIDSDGRPLPAAIDSDTLWISPGERYGVLLNPLSQFVDSIAVNYVSMNTGITGSTQYVPVRISGFYGIDVQDKHAIRVHPNPSNGQVTLALPDRSAGELTIFNSSGQQVMSRINLMAYETRLDLSSLPQGMYLLRVRDSGGSCVTKVSLMTGL